MLGRVPHFSWEAHMISHVLTIVREDYAKASKILGE